MLAERLDPALEPEIVGRFRGGCGRTAWAGALPLMEAERLHQIADRFEELRVLVLGDAILDRYVWGDVDRISPEAPVPVVSVTRESTMLGGAANVAWNLASLGAQVEFFSVVGEDPSARELERLLSETKVDSSFVTVDPARPTTVKTRIIARAQQLVRFDRESETEISPKAADVLLESLRARAPRAAAAILQDYGKGLLSDAVIRRSMEILSGAGVPVFVDPKASHWSRFAGAELVKPNLREAQELVGRRVVDAAGLESLGREVLDRTGARTIAITRGAAGMDLFHRDGPSEHFPARALAVGEATGAGDTAIATLTLARAAGGTWPEAAELANAAAAAVVSVPGTAAVTRDELLAQFGVQP